MFPSLQLTREISLGALRLRLNWLILACVLVTATTFVRLAFWQLGRAEEKLQAQAEFAQQQLQNPLPIENIDPATVVDAQEELSNLHVALYGEYDNERTILLLAQFLDDQIGYEVITPFRLQGSEQLVLVSRGWTTGILPANTGPELRPVAGIQQLTAQIHVPDPDQRILPSQVDGSVWPLRVRGVEIDVLTAMLQEPVFPYVVRLTAGQPGVLARHWPVANADINTHLSYALQWFTFAVVTLLVALLLSSNLLTLMRDSR